MPGHRARVTRLVYHRDLKHRRTVARPARPRSPDPTKDLISTMRIILAILVLISCLAAFAATGPYEEAADSRAEIKAALASAREAKVPVLVVFGANWCADCKILDVSFKSGTSAEVIGRYFKVVKVNVGRFDRNVDIAETYGVPLKEGIPAVAVLNSQGQVAFATRAGELADARNMGDKGIHDFFLKISGAVK